MSRAYSDSVKALGTGTVQLFSISLLFLVVQKVGQVVTSCERFDFGKRRRFWTPENRLITLRQIEDDIETSLRRTGTQNNTRQSGGNGRAHSAHEVEAEQAGGEPRHLESANPLWP